MTIEIPTKFLLAQASGAGTVIFGSPRPSDLPDLVVGPWQPVPVTRDWLEVPHFVRAMGDGRIKLWESNTIPPEPDDKLLAKFERELEHNQKQLAYRIVREDLSEPILSAINVGDLLNDSGIPRRNAERITVGFLKDSHRPFLEATLELEKRLRNRPEVVSELKKALERIEAL